MKHKELIKKWADGAKIQYFDGIQWIDLENPRWLPTEQYREKPSGDNLKYEPMYGEGYNFINTELDVDHCSWESDNYDYRLDEANNVFRRSADLSRLQQVHRINNRIMQMVTELGEDGHLRAGQEYYPIRCIDGFRVYGESIEEEPNCIYMTKATAEKVAMQLQKELDDYEK